MLTRQAVILVGGKGTRLGALTANTPKPLMALDEDTGFLDEVLFDVARHGFDEVILAAGYLGEQFVERYDGRMVRGARIRVAIEPTPAGTGGALKELAGLLAPTFLFINGDTAFDINLRRLDALLSRDPSALAVLALRRVTDASRFGSVELQDGRIVAFQEKRPQAEGGDGCVNGGIGLFRREILDFIDTVPSSIESGVYPRLAAAGRLLGHEFTGYFIDIGLPETLAKARADLALRRGRPAVFFDRDGVLNEDSGYTHRPEDLRLVPGAAETIRIVNDIGALAIVVTNQAGVARGYYTPADVEAFHASMSAALALEGAHVDAYYYCPYHPDASVEAFRAADHPDRKPNPGMILRACHDWPIDAAASILIGDRDSDIEAARRAGVTGYLFDRANLAAFSAPLLEPLAAALAPLTRANAA